jgi:hypothetical protein
MDPAAVFLVSRLPWHCFIIITTNTTTTTTIILPSFAAVWPVLKRVQLTLTKHFLFIILLKTL